MPYVALLSALIGLLAGTAVVFFGPRLAALRLGEALPEPGPAVLVPVAGAWLAAWDTLRTVLVELLLAVALAALALYYGEGPRLVLAGIYTALLALIAYIDIDHRLVLNWLSYPGIILALAGSVLWPGIGLERSLLGAAAGLVLFGLLEVVGRGALGSGDTKLAVLIGAMRGFPGGVDALFLGVLLGGLAALINLIVFRQGLKASFAYAPYLAAGAVLSFFVVGP